MNYCLVCDKSGHTAFCCESAHAYRLEESVCHWIYHRLYQLYQSNTSVEELMSNRFERLSIGELFFLLRQYIDDKNKAEFVKMYSEPQLICLLLSFKTSEFLRVHYSGLSDIVKKRISIDIRYWIARAKMPLEDAERLRMLEIVGPSVPSECGVCLREGICKNEMITFLCAHSFCQECVTRIREQTTIKCPFCRENVLHMIRRREHEPNIIFEQCV